MIRKIWIINITIAIVTLIIFFSAYRFWHRSGLAAIEKPAKSTYDTVNIPRVDKKNIFGENSYDIIEKNNLFSPDRKASVKSVKLEADKAEKVLEDTTPPFIMQKYTLSAVILKDEGARALIKAPVQGKKENPVRWISINEKLDEFTVSGIFKDKVYIESSAGKYAIPLYKPKEKVAPSVPTATQNAETEMPEVISTQSSREKKTQTETKKSGDEVIDGKYKIIETPFGKSRIRIK